MSKDDSVVKSFRTTESQFNEANEIFRKEGFSFSEVIRLLLEATIRDGRIPRGLSTKATEEISDKSAARESYVDSILNSVLPNPAYKDLTAEERLIKTIFGEPEESKNMSNAALREWGNKWGLPDNLSVATLADLHDCGFFAEDPWFGDYDFTIDYDSDMASVMTLMKFKSNLEDHLNQMHREMSIKATKVIMELDNKKGDI